MNEQSYVVRRGNSEDFLSNHSTFYLKKMDCPSEERLVRMALEPVPEVRALAFNLSERTLEVWHDGPVEPVMQKLAALDLGAHIRSTRPDASAPARTGDAGTEARLLKIVLAINAGMFVFEILLGVIAQSTGLIADSLDMFADAAVYGMSLYVVGKSASAQNRTARISGWLQIILALSALSEVARRFFFGSEPQSLLIVMVSFVALLANIVCLKILQPHQEKGNHLKASVIFSTNDVLANIGVLIGGILVHLLSSRIPDLVMGILIAAYVLRGGMKILKLANNPG